MPRVKPNVGLELMTLKSRPELRSRVWLLKRLSHPGTPGTIKWLMNWAASHQVELYKIEGFNRKEGGARKLLAKEKKGLFQARSPNFPYGEGKRSYYADDLIFLWGLEMGRGTDYLISSWENSWLTQLRLTFPGEVETVIRLGIKPWFGDLARPKWYHLGSSVFFFTAAHKNQYYVRREYYWDIEATGS